MTLTSLATFVFEQGRVAEPRAMGEQALAMHQKLGDLRYESGVLYYS